MERAATSQASGISVVGNVQGENAARVAVGCSRIGGRSSEAGGSATLTSSTVTGQLTQNRGPLEVSSNRVGGRHPGVPEHRRGEHPQQHVNGHLQCKENNPPPTGGGNVVQGNKDDQCPRL